MTSTLPRYISRLILSLLILLGLGSGSSLYSQSHITTNGNIYKRVVSGGVAGTDFVIVDNLTNFAKFLPGDTVLLIQMKGVQSNVAESGFYGDPSQSTGSPGSHEFLIILSTNPGTKTIQFKNNLLNTYDINSDVQIIWVPSYYSANIDNNITCPAWDSTAKTGGVLTMIVGKTLQLNADIDVSGKGFAGGVPVTGDGICTESSSNLNSYNLSYTNSGLKGEGNASKGWVDFTTQNPIYPDYAKGKGANFYGGGAGNGRFSGGGGGANIGAGGKGGREFKDICGANNDGGLGGKARTIDFVDRIFMGGGGGGSTYSGAGTASEGGRGGGIVLIICNELVGNGHSIKTNGASPSITASGLGGSGGGGAGGSIVIYLESFMSSTITLSANGGNGGNTTNLYGEGGGGGAGLIWTNIPLPGVVTPFLLGGGRGTNNGTQTAGVGLSGGSLSGFVPVLNGFLFNTIRSSVTGNLTDSICSNNIPYPVDGTSPVGGSGNYTYLWQKRNTAVIPWTSIGSSNVKDYTFPASEADTFEIRRIVTDNVTSLTDTSKQALIIVQPKILNNTVNIYSDIVSLVDTVCFGDNPKLIDQVLPDLFVPTSKAGSLFYSWQDSSQTATWGSVLGNAKSFDPNPPGGLQKTTWYRRKVVSGRCADSTAIVRFTVLPLIGNNNISADQEICHGMTFADLSQKSGFVLSGGDNLYRYKWQISTTGAVGTWNTATGTINSSGYNPPESPTDTEVKSYYRRMVYSGNHDVCKDSSTSLLLTEWKKISNNLITSVDQTICSGSIPVIINANTPADGDHLNFNRTWQQKLLSGAYITAAGPNPINQDNYQPPALKDTTWYRRYVTSGAGNVCKDSNNIVVVNVHKPITNNIIALPSGIKDTTICLNQLIPLIKGADPSGGTNNPVNDIFLWQVSTPGNNSWNTATGTINGMSYQSAALVNASVNPLFYYYRRSFTSGMCTTFSDTVSVRVLPKITNNTISADQAVCYNKAPSPLIGTAFSGGDPSLYKYAWDSIGLGPKWTPIASTNVKDYTPSNLTSPTRFRRWIYSGLSDCCKDSVNLVSITINPLPVSTITPAIDTICEGVSKPFTVSITGSVSSPWSLIYNETYLKTNAITPSAPQSINTATSTINVTPSVPGASTDSASFSYTAAKVTDGKGCDASLMTGSRKLVVYKVPTVNAGLDAQICGPVYTLSGTKNVGTGSWFYPAVPVVDSVFSGNNFTATIDSTKSGLNWPYTFIWKGVNWTCTASDQATITFYRRASQAVTGLDKNIFTNTFSDTLNSLKPAVGTGIWSIVSAGPGTYLQDSIVFNLIAGTNEFKWTVSNGACSTSDNMTITTSNINIPQGFSPNGDNVNDEFEIQGLDLVNTEITLKILTSAGSQVYATDNLNGNIYKQWNGENEKGPLPDGTYYYILSAKSKIPPYAGHIYSGVIIVKRDK